jgi:ankyrin repeat protein
MPLSADFDPSDPASVRKNVKTAPRIVFALGRTRHEQLRALLARGENPNVCVLGTSILTLSAASGDVEEVEILLDGGADPDRPKDSAGGTPLLMALGQSHFDVARLLIDRGADVRVETRFNNTALIELANSLPSPALHAEQLDLAQVLVSRGVPLDARLAGPRTTALMLAAIRGNKDLVQLLLKLGADPGLADNKGQTALTFALKKGHADVAELLSAAGTSPTVAAEPAACAASPAGPCPTEQRKSP